ncbi:sulfite exporter TauE/SafE family protein [uncultured Ruminococcus sp.]|uniref:sulfite exporter TauE/SafE family protein n=1 Tax=uncultured Ruminococcus sp. TaxID=165186 RepID=UPI0025FC8CAD|nr:sulfite exporter TauE/SafE family protein [uncultured Ruminococcus sp.]
MKKLKGSAHSAVTGIITGAANGLFGSGGGMIAVPMLQSGGMEEKSAHATSIAITLALSLISSVTYFSFGSLDIQSAWKFVPCGLAGAAAGAFFMKKISNKLLKRIFGAVMIAAGIRLLVLR